MNKKQVPQIDAVSKTMDFMDIPFDSLGVFQGFICTFFAHKDQLMTNIGTA